MKRKKHAYCIMAHEDLYCLKTLLELLDDQRHDIYIHIDKKSDVIDKSQLQTLNSSLFIIPEEKSINVNWGGLSQVKAELILFDYALKNGDYSYIHLLSGVDLPLKNNDIIYEAFESLPSGTNIVSFSHGDDIKKNVEFKTLFYHPYVENQRFRNDKKLIHSFKDIWAKTFRKSIVSLQKVSGFQRKWNMDVKKGSQWVSLSPSFTKYLIKNKSFILRQFKWVICPDEIFIQTLLFNSTYKNTIYDYEGNRKPDIREIDWKKGKPYVWKEEDFNSLVKSNALFARKFSSKHDKVIIDLIKDHIKKC